MEWSGRGWSFFDEHDANRPGLRQGAYDWNGHGTMCANIIHAIEPSVEIVPMRIFNLTLQTSPAVLLNALSWAVDQGMSVLSLSLAMTREDARVALYRECQRLTGAKTIIVAAGRNRSNDGYPAEFDNVIGVGVDSRCASDLVLARGGRMDVTLSGRHPLWGEMRGQRSIPATTSQATALVAGVVAAMIERFGPGEVDETRERLVEYAEEFIGAAVPRLTSSS